MDTLNRLLWNMIHHKPTPEAAKQMDEVRHQFITLARTVHPLLPPSRETSLFATHLEEACMYAIAALARNKPPTIEDDTEEDD